MTSLESESEFLRAAIAERETEWSSLSETCLDYESELQGLASDWTQLGNE